MVDAKRHAPNSVVRSRERGEFRVDTNLTKVIPKKFYEIDQYDHFNRLLVEVYLRKSDRTWVKGRLAFVRSGCVFKTISNGIESELYRAISDAMYDKKEDEVVVECTTLQEYYEETELTEYEFTKPEYDPCRD